MLTFAANQAQINIDQGKPSRAVAWLTICRLIAPAHMHGRITRCIDAIPVYRGCRPTRDMSTTRPLATYKRNGALRFIRIGRVNIQFSISRR